MNIPPKKRKRAKPVITSKPRTPKSPKRKIEIPPPARGGDVEREGKKSIDWREDAEILQRLALVANYMNQNMNSWEIAEKIKASISTAKRDISRVRELWREDARQRLTNTTDAAIAQYGAVIHDAHESLKKAPLSLKAQFMGVILRAQERMDKVTGIADPIGGPGGGPIQVELTDVNKIRDERWKSIEDKLVSVVSNQQKESDGTKPTGTT